MFPMWRLPRGEPVEDDPGMKILVTGGTGFVGSHVTVALLEAGHDVRVLVRRPEQVATTFAPHGATPDDVVVGDVLDAGSVRSALAGCDAVVHAAAVFSFDPRRAGEMLATNEDAARIVLGEAVEAGCDPVVHISSTVVLTRYGGTGPELPLGDIDLPYSQSKIASEKVARELQARGAPVVIVYPGAVYGPHDPYTGEQAARLGWLVRGLFPLWPTGGLHAVDVRDVAEVVAAVMVAGRGPRRYVVPGHHVTGRELFGTVGAIIGRRRLLVPLPARIASTSTRAIDAVQSRLPAGWRYPADHEGAEIGPRDTRFDTSAAQRDLGVSPRPFADSIRDTISWMVDAGHLKEKYRPR